MSFMSYLMKFRYKAIKLGIMNIYCNSPLRFQSGIATVLNLVIKYAILLIMR